MLNSRRELVAVEAHQEAQRHGRKLDGFFPQFLAARFVRLVGELQHLLLSLSELLTDDRKGVERIGWPCREFTGGTFDF